MNDARETRVTAVVFCERPSQVNPMRTARNAPWPVTIRLGDPVNGLELHLTRQAAEKLRTVLDVRLAKLLVMETPLGRTLLDGLGDREDPPGVTEALSDPPAPPGGH